MDIYIQLKYVTYNNLILPHWLWYVVYNWLSKRHLHLINTCTIYSQQLIQLTLTIFCIENIESVTLDVGLC